VEILGLVFAGTATARRPAMARFVADVLGLEPIAGAGADFFAMPDGTTFAVAGPRDGGEESRTIGFLVADLDGAIAELRAAGVEVGDPAGNERQRYAHFHAPDGKRYELVEESAPPTMRRSGSY
jgi:glyoxylase I family protein